MMKPLFASMSQFRFPIALTAGMLVTGIAASAQAQLNRLARGTIEYGGTTYTITSAVVSTDTKFVAVAATATNVSVPDNNGKSDVFLVETDTNYVRLVSHSPGTPLKNPVSGNGDSLNPTISSDGRYVAFSSDATDLVPGDLNGVRDVFLFDRDATAQGAAVVRLSQATATSGEANGASDFASISDDGRFVAFQSEADNLVAQGGMLGVAQIYFLHVDFWTLFRVSNTPTGGLPNGACTRPAISGSHAFIAFESLATNLTNQTDANGAMDVFITQPGGSITIFASQNPNGGAIGNGPSQRPSISTGGQYVAFESRATNLAAIPDTGVDWDIFLTQWTGTTTNGPQSITRLTVTSTGTEVNGDSNNASISRGSAFGLDGQFVGFDSTANNLAGAPGMSSAREVFVCDREKVSCVLVSGSTIGLPVALDCIQPSLGTSTEQLCFLSADDNLCLPVEGAFGDMDVFLRRTPQQVPEVYCRSSISVDGCVPAIGISGTPSASLSSPCWITLTNLPAWRYGEFFCSVIGPNNAPLAGSVNDGYLCVATPTMRLPPLFTTNGTIGGCDGTASFDINAAIQGGQYPQLTAGTRVWVQAFCRDGSGPNVYTQSVSFVIQP